MIVFEVFEGDGAIERNIKMKDGNNLRLIQQTAYLYVDARFPRDVTIPLQPNGNLPYQPGKYSLCPSCLSVDGYNRLSLDDRKIRLIPLPTARDEK